ncbi:MAG: hypothetical protein D4R80_00670 [Deltaproteobacteria bacterium]|nr:MAG: hypothetical protein D4R80_00670 [Deltaproteobacteria bacterium]
MNNVSGGGSLIVAGSMGAQETVHLSDGGSLAAVASKGVYGDAASTGNGIVVVAVSKGGLGDPAVSGNGTIVLAGRAGARKAVLVHGGGATAAQGWKGAKVAAHLSGGGAVVIAFIRTGGSIHYAYLPGGGALWVDGAKEARAPPAVHGGGEILAKGVRFYTDVAVRAPAKHEPIRLVYLHLDYCGNVFGTAPCLATGTPCFNTWKTCKYLSAFDNIGKTYKYSEVDAALPFKGVRPYVKSVKLLPTEIKTNLTVNARVSVTMVDEMDQDVDTDPYLLGPGRI